MGVIRFDSFGGQIPALDERLLPKENAAYSQNAFLQGGRLEPLAADIPIHTLASPTARYAFRVPKINPGIDHLKDSMWLEFDNPLTSVVLSPVTDTADGGRFYWCSSSEGPSYTTKDRVENGDPTLVLGIPRPPTAPTVTPSDVITVPLVTRAYVYTWVSELGEESQPSPPTLATGFAGAAWEIGVTPPGPAEMEGRLLDATRIYRTVSDVDGNTAFFFVDEIAIDDADYTDTLPDDVVAANEQLQSEDWAVPPVLVGMVSMPNGMIAGWKGNEVWFCEPYRPHAWPTKYMLSVEPPIVGLGTIDQNLMILTEGQPYVATGIHPAVMATRQIQPLEPCTAQGSIVSSPNGVLYTSYNGLILIGPGGGQNITFDVVRKDDWMRLLNLRTIHASYFSRGYYCFSGVADTAFQSDAFQNDAFQQADYKGTQVGAHIASELRLGYMTLTSETPTFNVMTDVWTGETFVIRDGKVLHVDRRNYDPRRPYLWTSKLVQLLYKENYSTAKIFHAPPLGKPPPKDAVTRFRFYADGVLKHERPLPPSGTQFRLPSGYKADVIQFELEGVQMIFNVQLSTSPTDMRTV